MHILFAWEAGSNYGHVTQIVELAKAFQQQNKRHNFTFVLKTPSSILSYLQNTEKCKILQAPFSPPEASRYNGNVQFYSHDLMRCGYDNPQTLAGLIKAWKDLFQLTKPDFLITQAAPTALLAAKEQKFKKVSIGGGYDLPPLTTPQTPATYWENLSPEECQRQDDLITENINEAQDILGLKPVKNFADAFSCDGYFLTTFEELDHYPDRDESRYYGASFTVDKGQDVSWKEDAEKRVLCYLQTRSKSFGIAMEALSRLPKTHDIIVSSPHISGSLKTKIERNAPHIRLFNKPLKLSSLLGDCDLGISHGSRGIGSAFAAHGIPQMVLPNHIEQYMFARALGRQKLARGLMGDVDQQSVLRIINELLEDQQYKESAEAFSEKYKDFNSETISTQIATDMMKIYKGRKI